MKNQTLQQPEAHSALQGPLAGARQLSWGCLPGRGSCSPGRHSAHLPSPSQLLNVCPVVQMKERAEEENLGRQRTRGYEGDRTAAARGWPSGRSGLEAKGAACLEVLRWGAEEARLASSVCVREGEMEGREGETGGRGRDGGERERRGKGGERRRDRGRKEGETGGRGERKSGHSFPGNSPPAELSCFLWPGSPISPSFFCAAFRSDIC